MNTLPGPSNGVEHSRTPQEPAEGHLVMIPVPDGFDLGDLPQLHPFFDGGRLYVETPSGKRFEVPRPAEATHGPTWTRPDEVNPPLEHYETSEVLAYAVEQLERVRDLLVQYSAISKKRGRS